MLNNAQELFLVLFSILYGVMLQSITGLQPFPLGRTLRGYVKRDDDDHRETKFMQKGYCESKDEEWLKRMWRRRFFLSVFFLNLGPIVYLWIILGLIGNAGLVLFTKDLTLSLHQLLLIGIVFWSALGVFGFYRLYHAIAVWKWKTLFCDIVIERFEERGVSFDAGAHAIWGIFYLLLPGPFCLWLLNVLPWGCSGDFWSNGELKGVRYARWGERCVM